jgi:hypothetical protein
LADDRSVRIVREDGMPWDELPEDFRHLVLVDEEDRYSIWRGHAAIPAGWPGGPGRLADSGGLDAFRHEAAAGRATWV